MNMPQFTAGASLYTNKPYQTRTAVLPVDKGGGVSPALVGRWTIFGCEVECIEVCTRFCGPIGYDCCNWETRCSVDWGCLLSKLPRFF